MAKGLLLENLLNEYLLEIQLKSYSDRTLKSVKNNNLLFFSFLKSEFNITTLEKLSHLHIKAYVKQKQNLGLKATYINSILKNLSMFFNYLQEEDYISTNLAKKVRWQKEDKVIIKSFVDKEVSKMIKVEDLLSTVIGSFYIESDEHEWSDEKYIVIIDLYF